VIGLSRLWNENKAGGNCYNRKPGGSKSLTITKKSPSLPSTIEKLNEFIIVHEQLLQAQKAQLKAISKVSTANQFFEAKLVDAQNIGDLVVDAEGKLGKLLAVTPLSEKRSSSSRGTCSLPEGITKKHSHRAQTIAANPEIVAQAKKKARKRKEIVTVWEVYREVKKAEAKKKLEEQLNGLGKIPKNCDLRVCSCGELIKPGLRVDAVITDPPYGKDFLPVYSELAKACRVAKVPLVAVMTGLSYLPEVLSRLCRELPYLWVMSYLTPGGQAVQ